jgi:hypothetical protein
MGQAGSACASMAWIDGNCEGLKTGAHAHVGARTEPSRSLKTVDPTRVHNQESRAVTLAKHCRP